MPRKPRQPRGALARVRAWMPAGLLDAPYELGLAPQFHKGERISETVKRSARFGARKAALPLGPSVAKGVLDALALLGPEALPFIAGGHRAVDAIDRATRGNGRRARRNFDVEFQSESFRAAPRLAMHHNGQPRVKLERRVTGRDVIAELKRRGPLTDNELADALGVFDDGQSDRESRAFRQLDSVLYALQMGDKVHKHGGINSERGEYFLPGNPPRRNGGARRKRHASTRRRARGTKRTHRHRGGSSTVQSLLFARDRWSVVDARRWAAAHGYVVRKVDVTANQIRLRQRDPAAFKPGHWGTIPFGDEGIQAVVGVPRAR